MRALTFVQARMRSTRLPGKSLLPVWREMSLLELVLRRAGAARMPEGVVLATGDDPADDPLAELADRLEVPHFRGSEADVLGRFAEALEAHPADAVIRVCADNPFVDPEAVDALAGHLASHGGDLASNSGPESGLPDGSGAEILSAAALREAAARAEDPAEREHLTIHLLRRPDRFSIAHLDPPAEPLPRLKLDIDSSEDLERMRRLAEELPGEGAPLWPTEQIVAVHERAFAGDDR